MHQAFHSACRIAGFVFYYISTYKIDREKGKLYSTINNYSKPFLDHFEEEKNKNK